MIVYLARVIPAFVMYCVNGASHSSLLIESTDSMIFGLPALASGFLFIPIWGMRTTCIILCCAVSVIKMQDSAYLPTYEFQCACMIIDFA